MGAFGLLETGSASSHWRPGSHPDGLWESTFAKEETGACRRGMSIASSGSTIRGRSLQRCPANVCRNPMKPARGEPAGGRAQARRVSPHKADNFFLAEASLCKLHSLHGDSPYLSLEKISSSSAHGNLNVSDDCLFSRGPATDRTATLHFAPASLRACSGTSWHVSQTKDGVTWGFQACA